MADSGRWQTPFCSVWTGQAFSIPGIILARFAFIWWLTGRTGAATVLATSALFTIVPSISLGPCIGSLADRWRRRWIMVVADGTIALFTV